MVDDDHPEQPYLNAGFFVIRPSKDLFAYYESLLRVDGKFDPTFPEQNLLNYAHRRDGPMPWAPLGWRWNMNWPTMADFEGGARSFHAKYWDGYVLRLPSCARALADTYVPLSETRVTISN